MAIEEALRSPARSAERHPAQHDRLVDEYQRQAVIARLGGAHFQKRLGVEHEKLDEQSGRPEKAMKPQTARATGVRNARSPE